MLNKKILEEYNIVKQNVGLFDFSIEGKIKVTGTGRVDFINGLVSSDIKNLDINNGIYAAFLDRFGKVLSDCIIYKFKDFLLINLSLIGKNNIIKKLNNEAALGKSIIEDISLKYGLLSLQGPKSLELLNKISGNSLELKNQYQSKIKKISISNNKIKTTNNSEKIINEKIKNFNKQSNKTINNKNNYDHYKKINNNEGIINDYNINNNPNNNEFEITITKNNRTTEEGYDIFVPASFYHVFKKLILDIEKKFNIGITNNETYNILRLEAKIPLYGMDFDQKNIISEITEKAIDYKKGCFVGQEIVARIKNIAHGKTAKRLMFLEIESNKVLNKNEKIIKDNKEIGYITSAAFSPKLNKVAALGFVQKGFYEPNTEVEVSNNKAIISNINQ